MTKRTKISIVMPSYNQGQFIGEAIDSILAQGYPNLEVIVIDGRSTDESVDIIKSYAHQLHYWCSESDNGQSDAINKGVAHATGDLLGWINSDDVLIPGALTAIARAYETGPTADIVTTNALWLDQTGHITKCIRVPQQRAFLFWRGIWHAPAPCIFFKRSLFHDVGGLDAALHLSMDVDLWFRMMRTQPHIRHVPEYLGGFRLHADSKSVTAHQRPQAGGVNEETDAIHRHSLRRISPGQRHLWWLVYKLVQLANMNYMRQHLNCRRCKGQHWTRVSAA